MNHLLKKVLELDTVYLDTFTNRINTSWGKLFYNMNQPVYYDANHAEISENPKNAKAVIEEVLRFYQEKNIIPRFYLYNLDELSPFLKELSGFGFRYEELVSPIQIWSRIKHQGSKNEKVTIETVTESNYNEALEIECSIKELGGRAVREKALAEEFNHPFYTHYLLRYEGIPCSTASIFAHDGQARMESVATLEAFRGKGLIGELIYFLQEEVEKRGIEDFWVFPINERVEKVYARYGFETAGKLVTGHAFLSGKSIKEIQQG
ncbi:GNAT family N-acetyltransferase [Neobacillus dielmonensis]|uniref:GNAT family N-acetyltransferase n=1 Tax=Neobacillus dielmonensis TaxID=1347369 RepID=UPI0005A5D0E3|nr:GNAT family N-acetyltransferase [Neobacillus dielmonensis]